MSKRLGQFQPKKPQAAKKAKLDIEIVPSQQYHPQPATSAGSWKPKAAVNNNAAKMDALWGDEDDEFIVLASQAMEEMSTQSQMFNSTSLADVTFGKFSRNVQTSTQTIVHSSSKVVAKPAARATDKQVAELFADGEDDIFTEKFDDNYENIEKKLDNYFDNEFDDDFNLDEFRQEGQKPLVSGRIDPPKPLPEPEFKVPTQTVRASASTAVVQTTTIMNSSSGAASFHVKAASPAAIANGTAVLESAKAEQAVREKKQEHAKDIQVKFLTKRLEQFEQKVETLQRDYNDALEKTKIKDGEVLTLRYKLKTVNDTIEQQRMEKLRETDTIQKEWLEKQKKLEKLIAVQTAELKFKEMELMNLRMKRANNARRAVDVREKLTDARPDQEAVSEQSFILCSILSGISISRRDVPLVVDPQVFSVSTERADQCTGNRKFFHSSRSDSIIAHQLVTLQTCLSQLVSGRDIRNSIILPASMLPTVVKASEEGFAEITQYCQRLVPAQPKDKELNADASLGAGRLKATSQARSRSPMDLACSMSVFQLGELFPGERAPALRRFLAVLGVFSRLSDELVDETMLKEHRIDQLARDLKLVSNAGALNVHHGMVTGAAALLKGISFRRAHLKTFTEQGTQLVALFRSIVLCQIGAPSSMHELSAFLCQLSARTEDGTVLALINHLCRSQYPTSGVQPKEKYRMKTISFTDETCTLQMYANLLESSAREHVPYDRDQLQLLLANADNTICFLRNVLVPEPALWVKNFIVGRGSRECNLCHIRMVSALLALLHRMLQCWHQRTVVETQHMDKLYSIARNATLLLYDLFGTAYCSKLLLLGGDAVKYRLRIVYDWFREHQGTFQFQSQHVKALERLDLRLLMNDPLKSNHEAEADSEADTSGQSTVKNSKAEHVKQLYAGFFKNKYCLQG